MKTRLNINIDSDVKEQVGILLNDMGLDYTTAITIFFKQMIRERKFPFEITSQKTYSLEETIGPDWREGLSEIEDEWE